MATRRALVCCSWQDKFVFIRNDTPLEFRAIILVYVFPVSSKDAGNHLEKGPASFSPCYVWSENKFPGTKHHGICNWIIGKDSLSNCHWQADKQATVCNKHQISEYLVPTILFSQNWFLSTSTGWKWIDPYSGTFTHFLFPGILTIAKMGSGNPETCYVPSKRKTLSGVSRSPHGYLSL